MNVQFRSVLALSLCCLLSVLALNAQAEKVVRLEGIKIQGDNEAPQVMYIIPWQNSKGAERLYSPIRGSQVQRLRPLDPYSFEREQSLHQQWVVNQSQTVDQTQN